MSALDAHVFHGGFKFGVGVAPSGSNEAEGLAPSRTHLVAGALRWLGYIGLLSSLGMLLVARLAANPPRLQWARPRLRLALALALAGGAGVVVAEALNASPSPTGIFIYLTSGPPGWARIARVAAEAAALVAFMRAGDS